MRETKSIWSQKKLLLKSAIFFFSRMIIRLKSSLSRVNVAAALKSSSMLEKRIAADTERRLRRAQRNVVVDRQEFLSIKSLLFSSLNALKSGPLLRPLVEEYKIQFTTVKLSQDRSEAKVFWKCETRETEVGPQLVELVKDLEIDLKATERLGSNIPKITFQPDPSMKAERFLNLLNNIPIQDDVEMEPEPPKESQQALKSNVLSFDREQVLEKVHNL